jgi:hypothetical protein
VTRRKCAAVDNEHCPYAAGDASDYLSKKKLLAELEDWSKTYRGWYLRDKDTAPGMAVQWCDWANLIDSLESRVRHGWYDAEGA